MEKDIFDIAFEWLIGQIGWFGVIYLIVSIPIAYALWDYKKAKRD